MRVAIVDHEEFTRQRLERLLCAYADVELVAAFGDAEVRSASCPRTRAGARAVRHRIEWIAAIEPLFRGEYLVTLADGTTLTSSRTQRGAIRAALGLP